MKGLNILYSQFWPGTQQQLLLLGNEIHCWVFCDWGDWADSGCWMLGGGGVHPSLIASRNAVNCNTVVLTRIHIRIHNWTIYCCWSTLPSARNSPGETIRWSFPWNSILYFGWYFSALNQTFNWKLMFNKSSKTAPQRVKLINSLP